MSNKGLRSILFLSGFLFLLLQYQLWLSKGGIFSALHLKKSIAVQQQKNIQLAKHNDALRAEIIDLKTGNQAVSERARSEMGMIKNGEVFYQVAKHQ